MKIKKIGLIAIAFSLLLASPLYAETNVSILYGYNGTAWKPYGASPDGTLQVNPNVTKSSGIVPKTNNTFSIGSVALQWSNVFASNVQSAGPLSLYAGGGEKITVLAGGNVGIGNTNPQQALVVGGQANLTGTTILNGTTTIRSILYNWPSGDGSSGQVLTTNAAGGLTWTTFVGGSSNISAVNVTSGSFGADVGGGSYSFPNNISVAQNISASGRITDKTGNLIPVGTIAPFMGALAPAGWLMANGSEVNRTTYPDLFNITGTIYGNTSDSTFTLPDLRQRFPLGKADSGTGSTLGGTGGAIDHTHTGPSHTHTYSTVISHTHSVDPPSTASDSQGSHTHSIDPASTASSSESSHTHSFDPPSTSSSSDGAHTHTKDSAIETGGAAAGIIFGTGSTRDTDSGGSHSHTAIDIASLTSGAEASHTHSTDIASSSGSTDGGHTHSTDVASFTSGSTGSASGTSDAGGTGATGTGNPPFIAVNYIVKY